MKLRVIEALDIFPHPYRASNLRKVRLNLRHTACVLLTASKEGRLLVGPAKSVIPQTNG